MQAVQEESAGGQVKFQHLPVDVLKNILKHIIGPSRVRVLDDRSILRAKDAYALCCNNSSLYSLFRASFHSLFLSYGVRINVSAIARLFSRSLRHVSVYMNPSESAVLRTSVENQPCSNRESYSATFNTFLAEQESRHDAAVFFDALAKCNPQLESLSVHISGTMQVLPAEGLSRVIKSSGSTLKALRLAVPLLEYDCLIKTIASSLSNLEALCLEGPFRICESDFLLLLESAGANLQHLVLAAFHEFLANGATPLRIAHHCPKLTHVELQHMPESFNLFAHNIALPLASQLSYFECREKPTKSTLQRRNCQLHHVAQACPLLTHLTLNGKYMNPNHCMHAVAKVSTTLQSLRMDSLRRFSAAHFSYLANHLPHLRKVCLNLSEGDRDCLKQFIKIVGPQLRVLDIQSSNITPSDALLHLLSACKQLHEFRFICNVLAYREGEENATLTKAGMVYMLHELGTELRSFHLDLQVAWSALLKGNVPPEERLTARTMVDCVLRYCPKIESLTIIRGGWVPAADNEIFERAEKRRPNLSLYLHEPAPFWFTKHTRPWEGVVSAKRPFIFFN